jgi:hypothetical protein
MYDKVAFANVLPLYMRIILDQNQVTKNLIIIHPCSNHKIIVFAIVKLNTKNSMMVEYNEMCNYIFPH